MDEGIAPRPPELEDFREAPNIASRFDLGKVDGINLSSILISAGGACLLLAVLRLFRGKD